MKKFQKIPAVFLLILAVAVLQMFRFCRMSAQLYQPLKLTVLLNMRCLTMVR